MKKHRIKFFLILLICCLVIVPPRDSFSLSPVAVISGAVLGALILAGATMSPQQSANYYAAIATGIQSTASTGGNMFRSVYQAQQYLNSLGLQYLAGREAMLKQDLTDFYSSGMGMLGSLSQGMQDLLNAFDPDAVPDQGLLPGEQYQLANGNWIDLPDGANHAVTGSYLEWHLTIEQAQREFYNAGLYMVKTYQDVDHALGDTEANCAVLPDPSGCICSWVTHSYYFDTPPVEVAGDPDPDYSPLIAPLNNALNPVHPDYNSSAQEDIDKIFSGSPPSTVTPVEAATGDNDNALPVPDLVEIPGVGVIPEPLPLPDAPVEPDPLVDNELLQGIYNNTLATAKNTHIIADKDNPVFNDSGIINAIENITFDNTIVEQNTEAIKNTNQDIADRLESWEPTVAEVDSIVNGFGTDLDSLWTASVANMDTSIESTINNLEPIGESDKNMVEGFFLGILPAAAACTPLDFSFRDKEIIIGCEVSDNIKMFLSFFLYISTVFLIYTMVHRELRPNS